MTRSRMAILAAVVLAVSILSYFAHAGPMIPSAPRLEDTAMSLAKIKQVQININRLPEELRATGTTEESVKAEWTKRLQAEHIDVADGKGYPTLSLGVILVTDEDVPNALSYVLILTFQQPVRVERTDQTLFVPTYCTTILGLERRDHLARSVIQNFKQSLDLFLAAVKQANKSASEP